MNLCQECHTDLLHYSHKMSCSQRTTMKQHGSRPQRHYRIRCETRVAKKSGYSREVVTESHSAFPGDPAVFGGAAALEKVTEALEGLTPDPRLAVFPLPIKNLRKYETAALWTTQSVL